MDFPNVTVPNVLPSMAAPAVVTLEVPKPEASAGIAGKARFMLDAVSQNVSSWKEKILAALPKNFTVWLIAVTCLIVLVAVSRILTLQKSVTELQSRPVVDENMIRVAVRKHLEETVKAMEQHNKSQAMAKQAEDAAKIAEMQRQALAEQQRIALEQHQAAEQHRLVQEAEKKRQAESQFEEEAKLKAAELDKQRGFDEVSVAAKGETEEKAGKLANEEALDLEERDEYEKPPTVEKKKSSKQPKI
jgi:hypothetical protein